MVYECTWCGFHFEKPEDPSYDLESGTCPNCKTRLKLKDNIYNSR
jgi:DNA-directed RNA polymerase subunit RPC12/RpoP